MKQIRIPAPEKSRALKYIIHHWMAEDPPPPWKREDYFIQVDSIRTVLGVNTNNSSRKDDPEWIIRLLTLFLGEDESFEKHVLDYAKQSPDEDEWAKACKCAATLIVAEYIKEVNQNSWTKTTLTDAPA